MAKRFKTTYLVEIEWDEHIEFNDKDAVEWLVSEIFPDLLVHSNEIGDDIGNMRIIAEAP